MFPVRTVSRTPVRTYEETGATSAIFPPFCLFGNHVFVER
jgi:hypothetical protein